MAPDLRVMLARRPGAPGAAAVGHVDVSAAGRSELDAMLVEIMRRCVARQRCLITRMMRRTTEKCWLRRSQVSISISNRTQRGVLSDRLRRSGPPSSPAHWAPPRFVRERGPSMRSAPPLAATMSSPCERSARCVGLIPRRRIVTAFTGNELKPFKEPLLAFDERADDLVVNDKVYVNSPRSVENLLIDAAAVKARAPQTTSAFVGKLSARLSGTTIDAIERVCSNNAVIARRVERLTRDGTLSNVTLAKIRQALPSAALAATDFGSGKEIEAPTDNRAKVLIDIAADLYYQPLFDNRPRRVASYRRLQ